MDLRLSIAWLNIFPLSKHVWAATQENVTYHMPQSEDPEQLAH